MVDYSETIKVYNIKLVYIVNKMSTRRYTCVRGQGHSLTFVQGHSYFINFKQLLP